MRKNENITIAKEETDRKNIIEGAFKTIVHDRNVLAFIIKNTVDECKDVDLEEIREGIAHEKGSDLAKGREQDIVVHPTRIELDSSFDLTVEGTEISVIINIEAQNNYRTSYPLENRATFYASCVLASQKGNEMQNDRYEQLRPVYSIWVLTNPPEELRNTMKTYSITETTEGSGGRIRSLINIVFLNIGYYDKGSYPAVDLFSILMGRFDGSCDAKEKLRECFNLTVSDAVIGGAEKMKSLSEQSVDYGKEITLIRDAKVIVENIIRYADGMGITVEDCMKMSYLTDDLRPYVEEELERRLEDRGKEP